MDGAVFLDRDGTIIEDRGHLQSESQVVFFPETFNALRRLQREFPLFIVTNQSGRAKGILTPEDIDRVNRYVVSALAGYGIEIEDVYVCPHSREDGCECIKPNAFFIDMAAEEYGIDPRRSYSVGDHPHDVSFAGNAGGKGVYVLTGHGEKHIRELNPDTIVMPGIKEAADWILINKAMDEGGQALREGFERAVGCIKNGDVAAVPTETVYGLAANALDPVAVAKIFEMKGRPAFDPLIVHVAGIAQAESLVAFMPQEARRLAELFWPGPLTLVLPKNERVPDIVTSGLPTVAVRTPDHPLALALIQETDIPLAAPSANRFGRTSPTTAEHVRQEFGDELEAVIPGEACRIGVESTIISFADEKPFLLRPGGLPIEDIERVIGTLSPCPPQSESPGAPGMLPRHYAPQTPLVLDSALEDVQLTGRRKGLLAMQEVGNERRWDKVETLSECGDLQEIAANLFAGLRRLDAADLDIIVAETVTEEGLGRAVMDRLRRAAHDG